jgi:hypothetical protein
VGRGEGAIIGSDPLMPITFDAFRIKLGTSESGKEMEKEFSFLNKK